jgi:bifunctional oligoribonuclease and PAP phosphatase NrnA
MVATPPVPEELIHALISHSSALIIGHKNPDADSLTSQLVMQSILDYLGKRTLLLSPGPFDRKEIRHFEPLFSSSVSDDFLKSNPLVIVLDCSTPDRIEPFDLLLPGHTVAVIDHHASGSEFGDIRYVFDRAFSVTFLVFQIMKRLKVPLTQIDAQRLFFGLAADTGFFRHINEGRSEVFAMAAELAEAGASPKDIYDTMYGGRSLTSRRLLGMLLSRAESHYHGRLLVTWETYEECSLFGEAERDSDVLYSQLLSVESCDVVVYLRQNEELSCSVGLRAGAQSTIDVGMIAAGLGGGGHRKASGTTLSMPLEKAKSTVVGILAFYLSD